MNAGTILSLRGKNRSLIKGQRVTRANVVLSYLFVHLVSWVSDHRTQKKGELWTNPKSNMDFKISSD